jgi:hypothetical protein
MRMASEGNETKEHPGHIQLAHEAAKLDRAEEQALANESYAAESEWPEY